MGTRKAIILACGTAFLSALLSALVTALAMSNTLVLINPNATLPNGMTYYGPLQNGLFHGEGELVGKHHERYTGTFVNGLMEGEGESRDASGNHYQGQFHDGYPHGQGRLETPDGSVFEGEFQWGELSGSGSYAGIHGETYEGEFEHALFHGDGVYYRSADEVYKGTFTRGELTEGEASVYGAEMQGRFSNWILNGEGRYSTADGTTYLGEFTEGVLFGEGVEMRTDGSRYEGEFSEWLKEGHGKLTDPEGNVYVGEFEFDEFHGQGELTLATPIGDITNVSGHWQWGELENDPRFPNRDHSPQTEALLYNQHQLLAQAIDKVREGDPDKIELYFLGVAGYSAQDVFLSELRIIQARLDTPAYASQRMVSLINHYDVADTIPLATGTSIKLALTALKQKMNDDDILLVYLTSHGSQHHQLSINMQGLKLPDLPAQQLADALNNSGIRWQVVVVSACYSGGFIPLLENENTLVMTASRADRTSFGCGDDSDMTYFGKALFEQALPESPSFIDAFEMAKTLVYEREQQDFADSPHSEPQISVGAGIEHQLYKWRQQE